MRTRRTEAVNKKVELNSTTFTKIADTNPVRSYLSIFNTAIGIYVYVNLCSTGSGMDETGIVVAPGGEWIMPTDSIYIGEVCAKADADGPVVTVCEY